MIKVLTLIKETDVTFMIAIVYSDIMRTYIVGGLPRKCMAMFRELIKKKMVEI